MDRRAKKLEKARKKREQIKAKTRVLAAHKPSALEVLARSAARGEFGPCFISGSFDDLDALALVTVVVTRKLAGGQLVPGIAFVDRTCLGIKNAFLREAMSFREFDAFVAELGARGDGMVACDLLVAQSVVFHAIDYARKLGFEPHRDFAGVLFGPRPEHLLDTPWHTSEAPIYIMGPYDDVRAITSRLTQAVGAGGFELVDPLASSDDDAVEEGDPSEGCRPLRP